MLYVENNVIYYIMVVGAMLVDPFTHAQFASINKISAQSGFSVFSVLKYQSLTNSCLTGAEINRNNHTAQA
jgi:hypothetical protein